MQAVPEKNVWNYEKRRASKLRSMKNFLLGSLFDLNILKTLQKN